MGVRSHLTPRGSKRLDALGEVLLSLAPDRSGLWSEKKRNALLLPTVPKTPHTPPRRNKRGVIVRVNDVLMGANRKEGREERKRSRMHSRTHPGVCVSAKNVVVFLRPSYPPAISDRSAIKALSNRQSIGASKTTQRNTERERKTNTSSHTSQTATKRMQASSSCGCKAASAVTRGIRRASLVVRASSSNGSGR